MNSKISKILGVGLVLAVLASLLVVATPASAGSNAWSQSTSPNEVLNKILSNDIIDLAVASNGTTGYAVSSDNNSIYKTLDGGLTWAKTTFAGGQAAKVVVAPDVADGSFVGVIADGNEAWVSTDGGVTFGQMSGFTGTVSSIAISPAVGTARSIAIGTGSNTWLFTSGGGFGSGSTWTDVMAISGAAVTVGPVLAVQFSPNFLQDRTLVVVSTTSTNTTLLNYFNTATSLWNSDYTVYGMTTAGITINSALATKADLELPNNFMAFDATLRSAYIALDNGGLFRNTVNLSTTAMNSVDVNAAGDKLVAGPVSGNAVFTLASPATALPTTGLIPSGKAPSYTGTNMVSVAFFGANIGAATVGAESAFALSTDAGVSFNDVAFIDTTPSVVSFAVNTDGSKFYMVTANAGITSLWRKTTAWERIYKASGVGYIVRPVMGNFDAIFFIQVGSQNIMYSNDAGQASWQPRVAYSAIQDFAAESVSTMYVLSTAGAVSKATDGGYLWTPSGTVNVGATGSINLLSAGNLLVAGATGVAYTTDGGTTWNTTGLALSGALKATADKLTTGGVITAITGSAVNQFTIGTSVAFASKQAATFTLDSVVINSGVTYAMSNNGTDSIMYRSPITAATWGSQASTATFMGLTSGGTLYIANTEDNWIYAFTDVFAAAGPTATAPANNFIVPINAENGDANNVVFQWTPITNSPIGTTYDIQIALDSAFAQVVDELYNFASPLIIVGPTAPNYFSYQSDTTYYWRVRTYGAFDSPWSTSMSFKIQTLSPVKLVSPTSGATDVSITPVFAWSPALGAAGYVIEVSDQSDFAIVTYSHNTVQPVFASSESEALNYSSVYYWRVRPTGATYPTAGTPFVVGVFTTMSQPTTPEPPITITNTTSTITVQVPPTQDVIPTYLLWIIIGIGAILVITLIVLIVRTRRVS